MRERTVVAQHDGFNMIGSWQRREKNVGTLCAIGCRSCCGGTLVNYALQSFLINVESSDFVTSLHKADAHWSAHVAASEKTYGWKSVSRTRMLVHSGIDNN
jgi:hypothetical protein